MELASFESSFGMVRESGLSNRMLFGLAFRSRFDVRSIEAPTGVMALGVLGLGGTGTAAFD